MIGITDVLAYAIRDPRWPERMVLQALILIIPVVGWIAGLGWMMLAFDNVRSGRLELPPAGFHLSRGFPLFLVLLLYTAVIYGIPIGLLWTFGHQLPVGQLECTRGLGCHQAPSPWAANFYPWSFWLVLLTNFFVPSLIVNIARRGVLGGFDVTQVWRLASTNPANWVIAGIISSVGSAVAGFGVCLCFVGLFFTVIWQYSVQGGIAAWMAKADAIPTP